MCLWETTQKEMTETLAAIKLPSSWQCFCTHGTLCPGVSWKKQNSSDSTTTLRPSLSPANFLFLTLKVSLNGCWFKISRENIRGNATAASPNLLEDRGDGVEHLDTLQAYKSWTVEVMGLVKDHVQWYYLASTTLNLQVLLSQLVWGHRAFKFMSDGTTGEGNIYFMCFYHTN
jgi:hypothetical protein